MASRRRIRKADYCDVVQVAQLYAYAQQGRTDRHASTACPPSNASA
jgi:hypothetical protein